MNVAEKMIALGYKNTPTKHISGLILAIMAGLLALKDLKLFGFPETRRFYYYQLQSYLLCPNSYYMRFWNIYCIFSMFNILVMWFIWSCS